VGLFSLLAAAPATWIAARISGKPEILDAIEIVPLLLAAYAFKLLSDFINLAFAASERDGHYAVFNIMGLILGIAGCIVAIPLLGIIGAAVAALASAMILFALRYIAWKRMEVRVLAIGSSS
jgi:O-antigen/teichoic acid export membrane protein